LAVNLDGAAVTDFGTAVKASLPVNGITNPGRAKLYRYTSGSAGGMQLTQVASADFSAGAMVTFSTDRPALYAVTEPTADQRAAEPVIQLIAALPPQVSIAQSQLVADARAAFEQLTPAQQQLVSNLPLLVNAEAQLVAMEDLRNQLIAINPVLARFSALPDALEVILEDRGIIEAARASYEALTDRQKELVQSPDNLPMYSRLLEAEAALAQLITEENQRIADSAIAAIAALPTTITLAHRSAVQGARELYNSLTAEQQLLVNNYSVLEAAEAQIAAQLAQSSALQGEVDLYTSMFIEQFLLTTKLRNESGPLVATNGTAEVTAALGGSIILGSEAAVEIPAGALSGTSKVKVSIQRVANPPVPPAGLAAASGIYEFTAGNKGSYNFSKPVTIILAFDPAKIPQGASTGIYYFDEKTEQWVRVGGTINGSAVAAAVYHFTKFAVFTQKAELQESPTAVDTVTSAVYFTDISNHWAQDYIGQMAQQGVISGYPDGTFRPNKAITRAEFATLLVKALKLEGSGQADYSDIGQHWARESIRIAGYHQIVNGYPDGRFLPDQPVTREEMVVMAVYAFRLTVGGTASFADSGDISDWAQAAVQTAVQAGIIAGLADSRFAPQAPATRAEAVTVLAKAFGLK
jgi:hypothetical protein